MLLKFSVILFLIGLTSTKETNHEWEIAAAVGDQIVLLKSNGSIVGTAIQQFNNLKALTFDSARHQFLVSDTEKNNDTIYSIPLLKETDITSLVEDLPDDVQGLAVDPLTDTLFWTDSLNKSIKYLSLRDTELTHQTFLQFEDADPQDIVIDSCRRYIYWTNRNLRKPSIERAKIPPNIYGTPRFSLNITREILVEDDLFLPAGITIDSKEQRLYWVDMRQGIYFRIESTDLTGDAREILYEATHQKPFGIAVSNDSIFWSDIINNAIWMKHKNSHEKPVQIQEFKERPYGIVLKNFEYSDVPSCDKLLKEIANNYTETATEYFNVVTEKTENKKVICESALCYNFCVHGECQYSDLGYPQCTCPTGFSGKRCEHNVCDSMCLNGGTCFADSSSSLSATCLCPQGYTGSRCEINTDLAELCNIFCQARKTDILLDRGHNFICRCDEGIYTLVENKTSLGWFTGLKEDNPFIERLRDPVFLTLSACMLVMSILLVLLFLAVCKLRKRPRIKRRIIVNKNVTPLTYRPQQPTEQCEITIENCCNMNVCETPCFEPPQLRGFHSQKKEEKKTLLTNMENGNEDLY